MEVYVLYKVEWDDVDTIEIVCVTTDLLVAKKWSNFSGVSENKSFYFKKFTINSMDDNIKKGLV